MSALLPALGIAWNPAMRLPEATALAILFVVAALWLARRAAAGVGRGLRWGLPGMRGAGLCLLAVLWLNPGRWRQESDRVRRDWIILLDRSASMQAAHAEGVSRWEAGKNLAERLRKVTNPGGDVLLRTFAAQLEGEAADLSRLTPDGPATDLARAVSGTLEDRAASLAGLLVISDGRQTSRAKLEEVALRARGRGVPIDTAIVGAESVVRDLSVTASPRLALAFHGQPVKLAARLENHGLGPIKPAVILIGPDGKELMRREVALAEGARQTVVFPLPEIAGNGGDYTIRTAPWPGEYLLSNNSDTVRVNVLASKTRVLMLEGAPYWDSKFLAQLLREQNAVDILTIHRLNEERYFRVQATGAEPLASPETVFPADAAALSRYDLIVFGKGADGFLTPERISALQGFVRDQGGAVLFARGKPYAGQFPGLEALEPVEWGETLGGGFRFKPVAEGSSGLFGAALPSAEDRLWDSLPPLEDVHAIARLRPFSRVLAEGTAKGRETRVPMLVARRFGRGMVAVVNADGLWRWDFHAQPGDDEALYQQFWVQLMEWCATYSEFRPGEDYAVRLRESAFETGQAIRAIIAWRGPVSTEPRPVLKITRDGVPVGEAAATALPAEEGHREWAAVVTPDQPGHYALQVSDKSRPDRLEGETTFNVLPPPAEADDLRADPESLALLAKASGGTAFTIEQGDQMAAALAKTESAATQTKPRWEPLWPRPWVALLVALTFGGEWWIRRREGLL